MPVQRTPPDLPSAAWHRLARDTKPCLSPQITKSGGGRQSETCGLLGHTMVPRGLPASAPWLEQTVDTQKPACCQDTDVTDLSCHYIGGAVEVHLPSPHAAQTKVATQRLTNCVAPPPWNRRCCNVQVMWWTDRRAREVEWFERYEERENWRLQEGEE